MRKRYIIGNWKMNKTTEETKSLLNSFKVMLEEKNISNETQLVVCPPFTSLDSARQLLTETKILLGAQNVHFEPCGAYTGEISIEMLKDLGVRYCIVGHSERRQYFKETDEIVNKKVLAMLEGSVTPVICVGETLDERRADTYKTIVENQLRKALENVDIRYIDKCIIAYEPIWAIGTGESATSEQAQDMCEFIRYTIQKLYGVEASENIHILYGGSVNLGNSSELFSKPDIDGALIGGASLKLDFVDIATICS